MLKFVGFTLLLFACNVLGVFLFSFIDSPLAYILTLLLTSLIINVLGAVFRAKGKK